MAQRLVLVVEDDHDTRVVLRDALESAGYSVQSAADGAAGLRLLRTCPAVDVVLLDLMMPMVNGYEVLREFEEGKAHSKVPVVVMSAYSDGGLLKNGRAFLPKPLDLTRLLDAVAQYSQVS